MKDMRILLPELNPVQFNMLFCVINEEIIGGDINLNVASLGKERDAKIFNSPYYKRKKAQNELKAEQRRDLNELFGK